MDILGEDFGSICERFWAGRFIVQIFGPGALGATETGRAGSLSVESTANSNTRACPAAHKCPGYVARANIGPS
jgi:hypothetical protein